DVVKIHGLVDDGPEHEHEARDPDHGPEGTDAVLQLLAAVRTQPRLEREQRCGEERPDGRVPWGIVGNAISVIQDGLVGRGTLAGHALSLAMGAPALPPPSGKRGALCSRGRRRGGCETFGQYRGHAPTVATQRPRR